MRIGLSLKLSEPKYNVLAQNIQALFADGSQGWWYDDNDTTTLFQDSAGTTPVTAVEQFVGLQLDKSKGLVLGPELVVNGSFATDSNWTKGAGWTISGGAASYGGSGNGSLTQDLGIGAAAVSFYKITFTINSVTGGIRIGVGGIIYSSFITTAGTKTLFINKTSGNNLLYFQVQSAADVVTITNISVRELPGNHRYAPASGNRPIWSKRVNLLTKTEQFDDAAWGKSDVTVTANATTAPDGTLTADLWSNTATGYPSVFQTSVPVSANATYVLSVYTKAATHNVVSLEIRFAAGDNALVDATYNLTTLAVTTFAAGATATCTDVGNGWRRLTLTRTNPGSGTTAIAIIGGSAINTGNVLSTGLTFYIWGADLRPANQATGLLPLYQRVNTSTDYETNGFPGYFKADGVDDFLQTNSIDFTATDKITLCAGLRKLSDAAQGVFTELSTERASNNGAFTLVVPGNPALTEKYIFASKGTVSSSATVTSSTFNAPITNVLTGSGDISGDSVVLRANGAQVASNTADQGTGNFGNYPAYFFHRNTSPATLRFNGYEYGNIAVGKLLTADQLTALETYMNGLTKAY